MDKLETLKHYFGHDSFRPGQETMVDALLEDRDCVGVMPTGAGKSMCYQIPALMKNGVALVVSPLISLMKDQVAALKSAGIPAAYLNSSLTARQMDLATERARQGAYRIIYVAPERLEVPSFQQFARCSPISLIAVDEAHCVSQWGQDFRPNYLKIADFVDSLPIRPVVGAFTATATARVRDDIIRLLRLRNPALASTGFDRPNLYFEVVKPQSKYAALSAILETKHHQSGIVYCATRKAVEEVCAKLEDEGFAAGRYHAGMPDEARRRSQEDFQYDRIQVMVATNAFGMGIDKSNVNYVIHYHMPRSMEAYYQEAGRAGRDGSDAECILLYSGADIYTAKWMIDHGEPNPELSDAEREQVRRQELNRLNAMIDYCSTGECLRAYILRYFGESAEPACRGCCHCSGARYGFVEAMKKSSASKKSRSSVFAIPPKPRKQELPAADPDNLFEQLRVCRLKLAQGLHVPPYIICDDKTLEDMTRRMPRNLDEMLAVRGMGTAKVGKWGSAFLRVIQAYAAAHPQPSGSMRVIAREAPPAARSWTAQEEDRLRRGYLAGVSVGQLSAIHGRTEGSVRTRLKKLGLIDEK